MAESRFSVDDILKEVEQMRQEATSKNKVAKKETPKKAEVKQPENIPQKNTVKEEKKEKEEKVEQPKKQKSALEGLITPPKRDESISGDAFEQMLKNAVERSRTHTESESDGAEKPAEDKKYHSLKVAGRDEIESNIKKATQLAMDEKLNDFFARTTNTGYKPGQNESARDKANELYEDVKSEPEVKIPEKVEEKVEEKIEEKEENKDTIVSPLKSQTHQAKGMLTPEEINGNTIVMPAVGETEDTNPTEEEEIDDYYSIKDADDIRREFKDRSFGVTMKLVITLICTLLGAALSTAPLFGISFGSFTSGAGLAYIQSVLLLAVIITNFGAIIRGFFSIFALRANIDSPSAVAVIASAAQLGYLCVFPNQIKESFIYAPVAMFAVLCGVIGKKILISRVIKNFQLVATPESKQSGVVLSDELTKKVIPDSIGEPVVCCQKSVINLQKYMHNALCEDPADKVSRVMSPIAVVVAILAGVATWFMSQGNLSDTFGAVALFVTAIIPIANLISTNLPLTSLCGKLRSEGGLVTGYQAVDEVSKVNSVVMSDEDLFPAGSVDIVSVKKIGDCDINRVIAYVASLTINTPNALSDAFDRMIDGRRDKLPKAKHIICRDGEGIIGSVDDNTVKFGNKKLMQNDGISEFPDDDLEQKALRSGCFPYYVSVNGKLCAVVIMRYSDALDRDEGDIQRLIDSGVDLFIRTNDPYLTSEFIERLFILPENSVVILSNTQCSAYDTIVVPEENGEASIANLNDASIFARTINGCKRVRSRIMCGVFIQVVLCVLGLAGAIYYTVMGLSDLTSAPIVLGFQAVSALMVSLIPMLYSLK